MLPQNYAFVEVTQREGAAGPWYEAILRDLQPEKAWVAFDHGVWPSREVPCKQVRPRLTNAPSLVKGAKVEARFAGDECPAFWCAAVVVEPMEDAAKCYVAGHGEQLLPLEALRAVSTAPALNPLGLTRLAVEVTVALRPWLGLADCRGCLEQVRRRAGLHLATPGAVHPQGGNGVAVQELDGIILLGSQEATHTASLVLRIHLEHQEKVEAFHRRRLKKLALLKDLQPTGVKKEAETSFKVPAELLGRTCGRKNERLHRIEREFKVEIKLTDAEPKAFMIYGDRASEAREALELRTMQYELTDSSLAWFQKENRILMEIAKKAELSAASLQERGLELIGSSSALEDARLLLESHLEYVPLYQEMDRQEEELQKSFEALERREPKAQVKAVGRQAKRAIRGKEIGS